MYRAEICPCACSLLAGGGGGQRADRDQLCIAHPSESADAGWPAGEQNPPIGAFSLSPALRHLRKSRI